MRRRLWRGCVNSSPPCAFPTSRIYSRFANLSISPDGRTACAKPGCLNDNLLIRRARPCSIAGLSHGGLWRRPVGFRRTELARRNMTADVMALPGCAQGWLFGLAYPTELARTAGVEHAAARGVDCTRDFAGEANTLANLATERGHGGEQRLGIGMMRAGEDPLRRPDFHQPAKVE